MKSLTKELQESYENTKISYICKEKLKKKKYLKDKNYHKVRDQCHYTGEYICAAHSICNFKYSASRKIPIAFHNRPNYHYNFIIKELAEEFENNLLV